MLENITLELSMKAFRRTDDDYVRSVCREAAAQWRPLLVGRKCISVLLWISDGSEILDYSGDDNAEIEWCRFIGTANLPYPPKDEPEYTSLHKYKRDYAQNAPRITYGILKRIVGCIKDEFGRGYPDSRIRVGETFDIGPEFAISDFKYRRHTEICSGRSVCGFGFIDSTARLCSDDRKYAAYQNGIPEGEPFAIFLGNQARIFLKDIGFDYLWLSNGLGFSANPWDKTGKIYDGERYYPERLSDTRDKVFAFWTALRKACPDVPIEVRGTNNSAGIDYASDGVPLRDIYDADLGICAPPNSPWAAINGNFGLEIMGHMSRVCAAPDGKFPFRYYLHDPWWVNSPWYDRYDGAPSDIYLPMAISVIDKDGSAKSASSLAILSIDNSYGEMHRLCTAEALPHLMKAEKDAPSAPGPLVWVYPLREYTTSFGASALREMNVGDNFICDAINCGLPLCTVTSTDSLLSQSTELYRGRCVLISPAPTRHEVMDKLCALLNEGVDVIVYGTRESLSALPDACGFIKICSEEDLRALLSAVGELGYEISYDVRDGKKTPCLAISRSDGAHFFSVSNACTLTDTLMHLPLGAPILCGKECEIKNGRSVYRFERGEHRECRVFIEQRDGVVSCREAPPVNAKFRRAIRVEGLDNATVRLFPEDGCAAAVSVAPNTDETPRFDERFRRVKDPVHGAYLEGCGISGHIYFLMERKRTK